MTVQNWIVVKTKPHKDWYAKENLVRQGHCVFLPYRIEAIRRSRKIFDKQAPLFQGYLFVSPSPYAANSISSTRGVSYTLSGDNRKPLVVPTRVMRGMFECCDPTGLVLPPQKIEVGEEVRISRGSFAGVLARVEAVKTDGDIIVLLDLMGQLVSAHVSHANVEVTSRVGMFS